MCRSLKIWLFDLQIKTVLILWSCTWMSTSRNSLKKIRYIVLPILILYILLFYYSFFHSFIYFLRDERFLACERPVRWPHPPSLKEFFFYLGGGGGLLPWKKDRFSKALGVLFFELLFFFLVHLQEQLIRKLAVILDVQDEDIIVEHLKEAGVGHRYVKYCLA